MSMNSSKNTYNPVPKGIKTIHDSKTILYSYIKLMLIVLPEIPNS